MDTAQQTTPPIMTSPPSPGIFGTKVPSTITFAAGILLFLLPFAEIKCNGSRLVSKTGLDIAFHNDWKAASGSYNKDELQKKNTNEKEGNSQIFAIIALGFAVIGLLLSFTSAKTTGTTGIITGILSALALIGLMIDMTKWFNDSVAKEMMDKAIEGAGDSGFGKLEYYANNVKPTLSFTPAFYIAILFFLAAAFLCYRRRMAAK